MHHSTYEPRYSLRSVQNVLSNYPKTISEAITKLDCSGYQAEPEQAIFSRDEVHGLFGMMQSGQTLDNAIDAFIADSKSRLGPKIVHDSSTEATVAAAHQYMRDNPGAKYEAALQFAKEGEAVRFKRNESTKARISRPTPSKTKPAVRTPAPTSHDPSAKLYFTRDLGPLRPYDESNGF